MKALLGACLEIERERGIEIVAVNFCKFTIREGVILLDKNWIPNAGCSGV